MKKFILVLISILLFSVGCDEEEVIDINCEPEIDQANINNALNSIPSCISEIENGEAMELLNYFVEFNNGEAIELFSTEELENWAQNLAILITENIIDTDFEGDWDNLDWMGGDTYEFDFDSNVGVYSWNPNTFSYDESDSDIIEINFPSSPQENDNNATFRMYNYSDYSWNSEDEIIGVPTSMSCELEVNNEVIFTINHSISFDDSFVVDNYEIPSNINISVFIDPVNIELQGSKVNPFLFNAGFSINSYNCDINVSAETNLLTTNYEDIWTNDNDEWMSEINNISLDILIEDLALEGELNCQTLYDITAGADDDITIDQINTTTDINVLYLNQEVGFLQFIDSDSNPEDLEDLNIVYCDNTQESVVFYINPLMSGIESILFPYTGLWWDNLEPGNL